MKLGHYPLKSAGFTRCDKNRAIASPFLPPTAPEPLLLDNSQNSTHPPRELDLYDMACAVWRNWRIILGVTVITLLLAALYAFLARPVYQTAVAILPPSASGVAHYNLVTQLMGETLPSGNDQDRKGQRGITPLTPQEAYRVFLRHLTSDALRQTFFSEVYLPAQGREISEGEREQLWLQLNRNMKVTLPSREGDAAQLSFEGTSPQTISKWANDYTQTAIVAAREELMGDLAAFVEVRLQSNKGQLTALRKVASETRANQIKRVEDALTIAESIGLENASASGNLIIDYKDETMYLRGAKALRAELERLKQRENDDPYIPELNNLLRVDALLSGIDLSAERLSVAIVDRAAGVPVSPVRPQKALILLLGLVLGLVISVLGVLLHAGIRRP